jgi:hypothetical protein
MVINETAIAIYRCPSCRLTGANWQWRTAWPRTRVMWGWCDRCKAWVAVEVTWESLSEWWRADALRHYMDINGLCEPPPWYLCPSAARMRAACASVNPEHRGADAAACGPTGAADTPEWPF